MGCSRCGAPLEFAEGRPATCHYCGQVEAPPTGHGPAAEESPRGPTRVPVSGGQTYGSFDEMPDHTRSDFEASSAFETHSTARPPPGQPSATGAMVGKVILLAAMVLGGAVVLSIVASSSSPQRHHPSSQHHHGR